MFKRQFFKPATNFQSRNSFGDCKHLGQAIAFTTALAISVVLPALTWTNGPSFATASAQSTENYEAFVTNWKAARDALAKGVADAQILTASHQQAVERTAEQDAIRLAAEDALKSSVGEVTQAKRTLRATQEQLKSLDGDDLAGILAQAQSELNTAITNAGNAQQGIQTAIGELGKIDNAVLQLENAVAAAGAASIASNVVVEAAKAAQIANEGNSATAGIGLSSLEDDFFNEASQQAQAAEKSASVAKRALVITIQRQEQLQELMKAQENLVSSTGATEADAYKSFAATEKSVRSQQTEKEAKMRIARDLVETATAELTVAEDLLESRKMTLQTETLAMRELNAVVANGQEMIDVHDDRIAIVTNDFKQADQALRTAQIAQATRNAIVVADLNQKLNQALRKTKISDSGNIVYGRFVIPATDIFERGSAKLLPEGQLAVTAVANVLDGFVTQIPDDIDWVLRIDGIVNGGKGSWQVGQGRALSIVSYLANNASIAASRMVASGLGDHYSDELASDIQESISNGWMEFSLAAR